MTDVELLGQWRAMRDAQAFRQIVARYGGLVYGTCRRVLADATEAEDVTQDCFVYLASRPPRIHTSLGAWLHRLATHRSYDRLKSTERRRAREERFARESPGPTEASMNDVLDHVDEAVDLLPDRYRQALVSHYYLNKTHADIARELGLSRRVVGYRIDKGLSRLREHLKRAGVTAPAAALTGFLSSNLCEAAPASLVTKIGSMALAGAAATPSASAATILGILTPSKVAISLAVPLLIAVAAWWAGTAIFPDNEEPAVEQSAASTVLVPSKLQDPPEDAVNANSAAIQPETQPTTPELEETPVNDVRIEETPLPSGDGGTIAGRVYDAATGEAIEGAEVGLYAFDVNYLKDSPLVIAVSDESGGYLLSPPGEGKFNVVRGTTPNYPRGPSTEVKAILVQGPEIIEGMDFPVAMGLSVAGRVVDSAGRPVAGALVEGLEPMYAIIQEGLTNDNGEFQLAGFEVSGDLLVRAEHGSGISKPQGPYEIVGDGLEGIEVVIYPAAVVSGVVVDEYGNARPGAGVRVVGGWRGGWRTDQIWADKLGRFSVAPLHPGSYELFVGPAASQFPPDIPAGALTLGPGEVLSDLRLVYGGGTVVSGRVTDGEGRPIEDARLQYTLDSVVRFTYTGSDGEYEFEMLPEGEATVYVNAAGYNTEIFQSIVPDGRPFDFALDRANAPVTVSGRVVHADTGEPVTVFEIASHVDPGRESNDASRYMHVQDPDGQFTLEGLNTFALRNIAVRAVGFPTSFLRLPTIEPGVVLDGLVVELSGGLFVQGVVYDPTGMPVADALVFGGRVADFNRPRAALARTDSTGSFQVTLDAAQSRLLSAVGVGFAAGAVELPAEAESPMRVEIRLHHESVVEGRVTYEGDPIYMKNLVRVNHPWLEQGMQIQSDTDANGAYRVGGLPPGPVIVEAIYKVGDKWRTVEEEVELQEGYVTVVDFDLSQP